MTADLAYLRAAMGGTAWAIMPVRLEAIAAVIERRVAGVRLTPEDIATLKGTREPNGVLALLGVDAAGHGGAPAAGGSRKSQGDFAAIGVINIAGIIAQRAAQVDDISGPGGTSTERVGASFRVAMADPSISAVVLNIDSPGGSVFGVQELADLIHGSRGQKPIVAQVNSLAASAAYWIATAADEIVVTPSGQVGSIGVYGLHEDVSAAADKAGVKFTFISAGKYKVEGNGYEPLNDEAAAAMQATVDGYYGDFVRAVARGRGVGVGDVRGGYGEGRVVRADDAVKAGMADRVATLDATLRRLGASRQPASPRAEAGAASSASANSPPGTFDADAFRRRRHAHRMRSA